MKSKKNKAKSRDKSKNYQLQTEKIPKLRESLQMNLKRKEENNIINLVPLKKD